jgi:hypothetical protein
MGALVWLASYPKSGNTWMRAFLHNLFMNPAEPLPPDTLTRFTVSDTHKPWYKAANGGVPVDGYTQEQLAPLRPKAHHLMTQAYPDSVFVKTHAANFEHCGVPLITPEVTAGAIYIVRNPLDVVISMTHHYGIDLDEAIERLGREQGGTAEGETNIPQFLSSWSTHVVSWTSKPNSQLHVVRYEDMLDKAFATFGGVAQFLGLPPSKDRLQKAIRFSSFNALKTLEKKHGFIERSEYAEAFFREGKKGQWRTLLTPAQVDAVVTRHREQMERFGYLP